MNSFRKNTALALAFLLLSGLGHAQAQIRSPVDLIDGNSLSFDGLSFTISGCTLSLKGGAADSCTSTGVGDTNDLLEISGSRRGRPTIEVLGNGTGTAGGSGSVAKGSNALVCNKCTSASELKFTLTLAPANGKAPTVTGFSNAIIGGTSVGTNSVTSNASYTGVGGGSANVTLANPTASATVSNALPTTMAFAVDLRLAPNASSILALSTEALHFSPAPEPGSIALLLAGMTGLVAARRYIRSNRGSGAESGQTSE